MKHPLQNRVTPFGDLIADPARGQFMGNRGGRLHDPATKKLLKRRWASKQWITCRLAFKNRRRSIMGDGYTELFFLDEATALAAGHRPCFECRREEALAFAEAWANAHGLTARPKAAAMDAALHRERLEGRSKKYWPLDSPPPPGAMIAINDAAYLVTPHGYKEWTPRGYGPARKGPPPEGARLLTPPSIVEVLRAGYSIAPPG